ncbi:GNAT family N-acetyltransferase [Kushneria aurantia]|uniref:GNAT family N-acetyltransferase n=1 Tax=Kushneria aurantia TaxID=504092 RepID=A0ABV6G860_9GAMM|nr:GNAT family N-acetyltransferase [Kushneria aurantia]
MRITVRPAMPADTATILRFINELASFEKAADQVVATEARLAKSLFGDDAVGHALIAERGGEAIGHAIYFFSYSTWLAGPQLWLEDLYVTPAARGQGAGLVLMREAAGIAAKRGCLRMDWQVLDWNTAAIDFYRAIGAQERSEWLDYRLEGEALKRFAEGVHRD